MKKENSTQYDTISEEEMQEEKSVIFFRKQAYSKARLWGRLYSLLLATIW